MKFISFLTTLLILLSFNRLEAQSVEKIVWEYNISHGLPSNNISPVMVDSKNRVWFGSEYGATCFDGTSFKTFTIADGLRVDNVTGCFEDAIGRIWFLHNGFTPSYLKDNKIKYLDREYSDFHIGEQQFIQLKNGRLFIGCIKTTKSKKGEINKGGLVEILPNEKLKFYPNNGLWGTTFSICAKQNSCLVFGMNGMKWSQLKNSPKIINVHEVNVAENNELFLTFAKHNVEFNSAVFSYAIPFLDKSDFPIIPLMKDAIITQVKEEGNSKYFCTSKGLFHFIKINEQWHLSDHLLPDNIIGSIDIDNLGNLWLTVKGKGLVHIPNLIYRQHKLNETHNCYFGTQFNNKIYVGGGGFSLSQFRNNELKSHKEISKIQNSSIQITKGDLNFYKYEDLECLLNYYYLKIWYKGEYREFDIEKESSGNLSYPLYMNIARNPTKSNELYFFGLTAFGYMDLEKSKNYPIKIFDHHYRIEHGVLEDSVFYFGCFDGFYKFTLKSKKVKKIGTLLGNYSIKGIIDVGRNLLIASEKKGVWLFDPKLNSFQDLSMPLLSKMIKGIYKGSKNTIWVHTKIGLQKFKLEKGKLIEICCLNLKTELKIDKLVNLFEINGQLILIAPSGFFTIPLSQLTSKVHLPFFIEEILVNGKSTSLNSFKKLNPKDNSLSFNLSAVSHSKFPINFYYRINGEKWISNNSSDFNFQSLQAGDYIFEFKADTPFYETSFIGPIKVTIEEYWWRQTWFLIACFILTLLIVILVVRWRILKIQERKRRSLSNELFSLQSQMNPHFTFNSLNSVQSYLSSNDKRAAQIYLADFAILMRNIMDQAKLNLITLEEEITFLTQYLNLEKRRLDNSFDFEIIVDESLRIDQTFMPTLMLQPFVENAVWHGVSSLNSPGKISISFQRKNELLICEVRDNGKGLHQEKRNKPYHKSTGINNVRERMRLFEELFKKVIQLEIINQEESGETGVLVRLSVPELTSANKLN